MKQVLLLLLILVSMQLNASSRIKKIYVETDQIVPVRTALGVATIIQVPDRPNSLVVGDSEAFKVEYLDQAITIKPLHNSARSNLYIYTDYRRFNVQLLTGPESSADYVVYLEAPKAKVDKRTPGSVIKWIPFDKELKNEKLSLAVNQLGKTKDRVMVSFLLFGNKEEIDPKWIWLTQNGKVKPIHHLIFSQLFAEAKNPARGLIEILKKDISETSPFRIEMRRQKSSYLTIPEVKAWR